VSVARRLVDPVLGHLAKGTLRARMPVEQAAGARREAVTHLEAFGRLIAGLAPWLELAADDTPEGRLRSEYAALARRALAMAVDPSSPDFLNFTRERQPLVDAAFLAQGLLRAPRALGDALDATTRERLVRALESTRVIAPGFNNWLLFTATVEAATLMLGNSIYVEQNYKACFGMLMLQKKYGRDRLEAACSRALQGSRINYTMIKNILEHGLDKQLPLLNEQPLPSHENIRGKDHYQ